MAYQRKTRDYFEVQVNYGYGEGWECATAGYELKAIRENLKEYRENAPEYRYRLKKMREKIA